MTLVPAEIRYISLHYTVMLCQDCTLPEKKTSAIRGGFGEMLLRANCISDRDCDHCSFYEECLVPRIFYSKYKEQFRPAFANDQKESMGYILECSDERTKYSEGDTMEFTMTLFGKTAVYFSCITQSFFALGQNGLGKDKAKFVITSIRNTANKNILDPETASIYMKNYQIETLSTYIEMRKNQLIESAKIENKEKQSYRIYFDTPLCLKHQKEFLHEFDISAIIKNLQRRIYMYNAYEECDQLDFYNQELSLPKTLDSKCFHEKVRRYSSRHNEKMEFSGIVGYLDIQNVSEEVLEILLAGEILHLGKNTRFGFGKIRIKSNQP